MSLTDQERQRNAIHQSEGQSSDLLYNKVMSKLKGLKIQQGQLLDWGAGRGAFLKICKKNNIPMKLFGVDLYESPSEPDIFWWQRDLNQDVILNEKFDAITAIEVIEHLENPRHMIRNIAQLMKKEGILILTTPNNESWRSILSYVVRGHFVAFTESSYPAHITALNEMDLRRVLEENKFQLISVEFSDQGMVPKISSSTWQHLSLGLLKGRRYSDNLMITAKYIG